MRILINIIQKLFLISLLFNIGSNSSIKLWENELEPQIDYQSLGIGYINSIAYDYENDYELILGNKISTTESYFFLIKNGAKIKEIKNIFNVNKIQSPLIKHNNTYFFCSSYLKLLYLKDEDEDDNLYVYEKRCDTTFNEGKEMKCFKMKDYIAIMYLNTHCFFALNLTSFENKTFTKFEGNYNFKAINNVYPLNNSIQKFIILREINITKTNKNYYLTEIKFDNDFGLEGPDINFGNKTFNFYNNIEITPLEKEEVIIFTYNINKINGCLFYRVRRVEQYLIQINGLSNFLKFLNESQIISAGFVENTPLLYYSIKNSNNEKNIGVADLISLLVIYNSKVNNASANLNLFTNNGYLSKNKLYLNYLDENKIIRFCPFIKEGNYCIYYVGESNFFRIKKKENHLYKNLNTPECDGKNVNNFYCLDFCPIGYSTEENNLCKNCFNSIDQQTKQYYSFKDKACISNCNNITEDNFNICYDCDSTKPIVFENQCISSCDDVFGETNDNSECIICKEMNKYYYKNASKEAGECLDKCNGKINKYNNNCTLCEDEDLLFFPLINECVSSCPSYFVKNSKYNRCELCPNDSDHSENTYYEEYEEEKKCVINCTNEKYGKNTTVINHIIIEGKNWSLNENIAIRLCEECLNQEGKCVYSCGDRYYKDDNGIKCILCQNDSYYVENGKNKCISGGCPNYTKRLENKKCRYCDNFYYNEKDNKCVEDCRKYELGNGNISDIKICIDCNETGQIFSDGECINPLTCKEDSYINSNNFCKKCPCINNNTSCSILDETYKCDCSWENYSYGYNCEFYSKNDINSNLGMYIISLNNRLIITQKNYFTYNLTNKTNFLEKNYNFDWKVILEDENEKEEEITKKKLYEKFFITNTKEAIFGINKELFDYAINNNQKVFLSLLMSNPDENYFHKIELRFINNENLNSKLFEFNHKEDQINNEMKTLYNFKTQQNYKVNSFQYYFQYAFLDYYNEIIPITKYSELEEINFYSPYLKGFYINVKNNRDEILSILLPIDEVTSPLNISFETIQTSTSYSETEKIYALISKLRNQNDLNDNEIQIIEKYINDFSDKIINKDGFYIEKNIPNYLNNEINNNIRTIINYSEPKLIFALINYFLINQKNNLSKNKINNRFINYLKNILNNINETNISNKTLSESDIKSIFRTLDNLYDALIGNKTLEENNSFIRNFIEILDKLCQYLSYITYPTEIIRLIGKRISLLSFHLGEHQKNISFPFIDNMDNISLNNFLNYSYDNYYLDEHICSQKNSTFLCLTNNNFEKLKKELISKNFSLNNIILNIYLLQDISKKNEKEDIDTDIHGHSDSDNPNYILAFKNYSYILKLYDKEKKEALSLNYKDILFDVEFPFLRELDEKEKEEKIDDYVDTFFKSIDLNITLYPNNSKFVCIPKNYYLEINKNILCKTHFNYDENKIRCSCDMDKVNEIIVVEDYHISNILKNSQFPKRKYNKINAYSSKILLIIILLFLIPSIYFLFKDLINHTKFIKNNNQLLNELQDERKIKYKQVKKYYNTGMFRFSIYLTLQKFPFFAIFNNYNLSYPKYIIHLVIYIGILIGIILPLIPFYYIPFLERQIFIDQRDIKYEDDFITDKGPNKYYFYFFFFGLIGLILSHLFIYILNLIIGYYKEENDIWFKIKTICKNYIYYEIKSEVLLGSAWSKIKLRMISFCYICGNYIIRHIKRKNPKLKRYLFHISRNNDDANTNNDEILPNLRNTTFSNIGLSKNNESILEMDEKSQILLENNEEEINIKNKMSIKKRKKTIRGDFHNYQVCKRDNFILDKLIKFDKSKRQITRFENIRNKYIYTLRKGFLKDIESDKEVIDLFEENKSLHISPQINYSFYPFDSFDSLKLENKEKENGNKFHNFIIISILLWVIFISLFILALFLIQNLLNKFDRFIIKAWLFPIISITILVNLILYYFKILIGTILIFHCYNLRKKKCFYKYLFFIFVDKSMVYIYKVRNLITKYKKEFDYL